MGHLCKNTSEVIDLDYSRRIKIEIDALWNVFWSGGISNPLSAIEQITYLLYIRLLADKDDEEKAKSVADGYEHESLFSANEQCHWDYFADKDGEFILAHIQNVVFPWIKGDLTKKEEFFAIAMKDAAIIIPNGNLMKDAIDAIGRIFAINKLETEQLQLFNDPMGDTYEMLLAELSTSGKNGQFRTPKHIIAMMVEMLNPKIGDTICDPAGGTAGFLLAAIHHLVAQHTSEGFCGVDRFGITRGLKGDLFDKESRKILHEGTLYGFDFDTTMVRIAVINLVLHGITKPQYKCIDSLSDDLPNETKFDIILANPPFKGSINNKRIWSESKLHTTKSELLFVERIIQMLEPSSGKAAIIVPDGVLFNTSKAHKNLREKLLMECNIQAIIALPSGVFFPYSGVSTNIIILEKEGETENIWFYDMHNDGFSLNDRRTEIEETDIPEILSTWKSDKFVEIPNKSFMVNICEISSDEYILAINRYKTNLLELIDYPNPRQIIQELRGKHDLLIEQITELDRLLEE